MRDMPRPIALALPVLLLAVCAAPAAAAPADDVSGGKYSIPVPPTVDVIDFNDPAKGCPGDAANQYKIVGANPTLTAWTYANGTHRCIEVSYRPKVRKRCEFWFMTPGSEFRQYATGRITFHFEYTDPDSHPRDERVTVDERFESAVKLGEHSGVERIWFGDDTGQRYPTKIAWDVKGTAGGLTQVCTA
ncbi:hypothetical protein [Microbispora catharanthi]|uniref:Uncharacterized protein n=1 Tax=Microbispora catharanthi TaxID=1712871 RepID=A0A5N6BQZ3_9ACTN|nr:hypothetical protein [Microbispora catharanthi]KAB8182843.1 hypothetical protein FH610_022950 [Microbispora catharanthi]